MTVARRVHTVRHAVWVAVYVFSGMTLCAACAVCTCVELRANVVLRCSLTVVCAATPPHMYDVRASVLDVGWRLCGAATSAAGRVL